MLKAIPTDPQSSASPSRPSAPPQPRPPSATDCSEASSGFARSYSSSRQCAASPGGTARASASLSAEEAPQRPGETRIPGKALGEEPLPGETLPPYCPEGSAGPGSRELGAGSATARARLGAGKRAGPRCGAGREHRDSAAPATSPPRAPRCRGGAASGSPHPERGRPPIPLGSARDPRCRRAHLVLPPRPGPDRCAPRPPRRL